MEFKYILYKLIYEQQIKMYDKICDFIKIYMLFFELF